MSESNESDLPEGVVVLGMIGAWSEQTEHFMADKLATSRGKITLSRSEAESMVDGFNRIQEGLVLVLNEDDDHSDSLRARDICPSDFIQAKNGADYLFARFDDHLFKCLQDGKSRRLSLSLDEVTGFRNLLTAAQRVFSALDDDGSDPAPDGEGGHIEGIGRIDGNVIYPEAFHRQAA